MPIIKFFILEPTGENLFDQLDHTSPRILRHLPGVGGVVPQQFPSDTYLHSCCRYRILQLLQIVLDVQDVGQGYDMVFAFCPVGNQLRVLSAKAVRPQVVTGPGKAFGFQVPWLLRSRTRSPEPW